MINPELNKSQANYHLSMELYSHLYLIKIIAATFAFEKYKVVKKNTVYNVNKYRISFEKSLALYMHFTSMSINMRNALKKLMIYAQ